MAASRRYRGWALANMIPVFEALETFFALRRSAFGPIGGRR
jgi:hypothetical protein